MATRIGNSLWPLFLAGAVGWFSYLCAEGVGAKAGVWWSLVGWLIGGFAFICFWHLLLLGMRLLRGRPPQP